MTQDPTDPEDKKALAARKREYLTEWMKSHPLATRDEAKNELVRHFGSSVSTPFLNSVIRRARDEVKAHARGHRYVTFTPDGAPIGQPMTNENLTEVVDAMRALGITKIEVHEDGAISCEIADAPKRS